jgi:hypothetical protein
MKKSVNGSLATALATVSSRQQLLPCRSACTLKLLGSRAETSTWDTRAPKPLCNCIAASSDVADELNASSDCTGELVCLVHHSSVRPADLSYHRLLY